MADWTAAVVSGSPALLGAIGGQQPARAAEALEPIGSGEVAEKVNAMLSKMFRAKSAAGADVLSAPR